MQLEKKRREKNRKPCAVSLALFGFPHHHRQICFGKLVEFFYQKDLNTNQKASNLDFFNATV